MRVHTLSFDQCNPPPGTIAILASLLTERIPNGLSLRSLVESIEAEVSFDSDLAFKLHEALSESLGSALNEALSVTFDAHLARTSLRFFDLRSVPGIRGELVNGVSDVHFRSDLSASEPLTRDQLSAPSETLGDLLPKE